MERSADERPVGALPAWKRALYTSIALIAPLALLEGALALAGVERAVDRGDASRGFSGLRTIFVQDGDVYRTRRDLVGTFNDQSFPVKKAPGTTRVFCLGGSSAYGFPWGADAAFCGVLQEVLKKTEPERRFEVVNASGLSYAYRRLNVVLDEVLGYEPDVVIAYEGHNEFVERDFFAAERARSPAVAEVLAVLGRSRIYSAMERAVVAAKQDKKPTSPREVVARSTSHVFGPAEKDEVVKELRAEVTRFAATGAARGAKVVLVTVPANLKDWRPRRSIAKLAAGSAELAAWTEAVAEGRRRLEAKDFAGAVGPLERAVALDDGHAEATYLLAETYAGLERWDEARAAYARAADLDASPERRLSAFNDAIREIAPKQGALLVDADRIFTEVAEHGLVGFTWIEDYVHPTREGHRLIAFHLWRALKEAGWLGAKATVAEADFDRALGPLPPKTDTENATWHFNQGVVLENAGAEDQAIAKYRRALELEPGYYGALGNLALILYRRGAKDEVAQLAARMEALQPDEVGGLVLRGNLALDQGRVDDGIALFRRAIAADATRATPHMALGGALRDKGDLEGAARELREAVRLDPDRADAHLFLGITLAELGTLDDAEVELRKAEGLRPGDARAPHHLGLVLERLGKRAEAHAAFERALRVNPKYSPAAEGLERTR